MPKIVKKKKYPNKNFLSVCTCFFSRIFFSPKKLSVWWTKWTIRAQLSWKLCSFLCFFFWHLASPSRVSYWFIYPLLTHAFCWTCHYTLGHRYTKVRIWTTKKKKILRVPFMHVSCKPLMSENDLQFCNILKVFRYILQSISLQSYLPISNMFYYAIEIRIEKCGCNRKFWPRFWNEIELHKKRETALN